MPKIGTLKIITVVIIRIEVLFLRAVMFLKVENRMTKSVDPDQTVPSGAV